MPLDVNKTETTGSGGMLQCVQVAEVGNVYVMLKAGLEQVGALLRLNFPVVYNDFYHEISLLDSYGFTGGHF